MVNRYKKWIVLAMALVFLATTGIAQAANVNFAKSFDAREVTMNLSAVDQFDYTDSGKGGVYLFRPTASGSYTFSLLTDGGDVEAVLLELSAKKIVTGKKIAFSTSGGTANKTIEIKRGTFYMLVIGKKVEIGNDGRISLLEPVPGKAQLQIMYDVKGHSGLKPYALPFDATAKERVRTAYQTDYYRFVAPYDGMYEFRATGGKIAMQMIGANGVVEALSGKYTLGAGDARYIRIHKTGANTGAYTLTAILAEAAQEIPVGKVELNTAKIELLDGKTYQLKTKVLPVYATDKALSWSSLDPTIAEVNEHGVVKAVSPGTTSIKATAKSGVTVVCQVKVKPIALRSISIPKTLNMSVGGTGTLAVKYSPSNASTKILRWASSNPAIATVDENGVVTAKAAGVVSIKVVAKDGNRTAKCTIRIK